MELNESSVVPFSTKSSSIRPSFTPFENRTQNERTDVTKEDITKPPNEEQVLEPEGGKDNQNPFRGALTARFADQTHRLWKNEL